MYDLLIIGGGPGGYVAASYAAQFGKKVALIEKNRLGGCCLNVGCIPTKIILDAAERFTQAKGSEQYGVKAKSITFDWKAYKVFSKKTVVDLSTGVEKLLKSKKVEVINGEAALVDNHKVRVGNQILEAKNIIIATGSCPAIPEKFSRLEKVLTSDSFWTLEEQPHSLVIIGGGVIGCEIASALSRLGTEIVIVEQMPQLLPNFSSDSTVLLKTELEKYGVKIYCGTTVSDIKERDNELEVTVRDNKLSCDYVLWTTGRRPVVPTIDPSSLDKNFQFLLTDDKNFTAVDKNFRTNIENVYCIGDANGKYLLAHAAINQAMSVVRHIFTDAPVEETTIPTTVFTSPSIARIGICTQEQSVAVGVAPYSFVGYSHVTSNKQGYFKIYRDIETDVIIGAEIVGHNACELIHVLAPYVNRKIPAKMFSDIVFAHPTLSEGIKLAVEASYTGSPQL